jgi:hypothetical protein
MRVYRTFVRLYPRDFRMDFGDDLMQLHDDLEADRGRLAAWRVCAVDLLVSLPRMHLERLMKPRHATTAITWSIVLLAAAGAASILTVVYPGRLLLGGLFIVAAAALAGAQWSSLARAIRVRDTALRHRRLRTAAVLAAVFIACYGGFVATVGDAWTGRETVLTVIGTASLVGAVIYLIAGLLTPRDAALQA